jgi:hypothetical protein
MDTLFASKDLYTLPPDNHDEIMRLCSAATPRRRRRGRGRGRVNLAKGVGLLDRTINQALNKVTGATVGKVIMDIRRIFAAVPYPRYVALVIVRKALGYTRTPMARAWGMLVDACPIEARMYALEVMYTSRPDEVAILIGHMDKVSPAHADFILGNACPETMCDVLPLLFSKSSKGKYYRDALEKTDVMGNNKLRFAIMDCLDKIDALE